MAAGETLTLAAQYLRLIADELRAAGVSVEDWLALGGLEAAQFDAGTFELTYARFERLLLDAATLLDEPAVGLVLGQRMVPSTHGPLGYAIMNSRTLRDVLELTRRFMHLRAGFLALDYARHGDVLRVAITELLPLGPIHGLVMEAVASTLKISIDAVAMGACPVRHVAFRFPQPGYAALAGELLGCPVRYDQNWTGLALPPGALDVRLRQADPEALRLAEALCQRELDKLASNTSTSARVRRLLLERRHGFPSLATTARLLRMTPRTLHRRLVAEGTAYRAIVEELRYRSAREHLEAGRISVEAIAYVLGYANPANFRRAFKRWAGMPPSVYRAQVQQAPRPARDGAR